jgi:hypothetical protein
MRGSFHGPVGNLVVELLKLHILTILNSTKRKRKESKKMILEKEL